VLPQGIEIEGVYNDPHGVQPGRHWFNIFVLCNVDQERLANGPWRRVFVSQRGFDGTLEQDVTRV
jgi:hypothetical protein